MGNPCRAIKQIPLQLGWLVLQSLVNQHQNLPKLKINQQPRAKHLNAVESPLGAAVAAVAAGAAGAAGAVGAAAMEVSEVADWDLEDI